MNIDIISITDITNNNYSTEDLEKYKINKLMIDCYYGKINYNNINDYKDYMLETDIWGNTSLMYLCEYAYKYDSINIIQCIKILKVGNIRKMDNNNITALMKLKCNDNILLDCIYNLSEEIGLYKNKICLLYILAIKYKPSIVMEKVIDRLRDELYYINDDGFNSLTINVLIFYDHKIDGKKYSKILLHNKINKYVVYRYKDDIGLTNLDGRTLLIYYCINFNNVDIDINLLKKEINIVDNFGNTAFNYLHDVPKESRNENWDKINDFINNIIYI